MGLRRAIQITACVMLGLAACTPTAGVGMLDISCQAPCWHGIMPGATTVDDALELIPQIPGVSTRSIASRERVDGREHVSWVMYSGGSSFFVELAAANDTVSAILLSLEGEVSLKDLFLAYGEPDTVGGFYGQGEVYWRRVFLLFDEGLAAVLGDEGWPITDTWRLKPSDRVSYFYFFETGSLHQLVQDERMFLPMAQDADALIAASSPWEGYSTVSLQSVR